MKFRKIRCARDGTVELRWTVANGEDVEERTLSSKDEPSGAFQKAMKVLEGDYAYALELTKSKDGLTVTTVSIDEDRHGNRGFVLSGVKTVEAGTYSISTPRLREPTDEVKTGPTVLTVEQVSRIDKLGLAAMQYVGGDRTQRRLPLEGKEEQDEEKPVEAPA